MATLYDGLNRPNATGMITYTGSPTQLQQFVTANTASSSTGTVTVSGTSPSGVVPIPASLDLYSATENGDQQAVDSITWDNGFATPDTVNFTAEIVPAGTTTVATPTPFTNTLNVVDNPPAPRQ